MHNPPPVPPRKTTTNTSIESTYETPAPMPKDREEHLYDLPFDSEENHSHRNQDSQSRKANKDAVVNPSPYSEHIYEAIDGPQYNMAFKEAKRIQDSLAPPLPPRNKPKSNGEPIYASTSETISTPPPRRIQVKPITTAENTQNLISEQEAVSDQPVANHIAHPESNRLRYSLAGAIDTLKKSCMSIGGRAASAPIYTPAQKPIKKNQIEPMH